jgi:hypothetical protein
VTLLLFAWLDCGHCAWSIVSAQNNLHRLLYQFQWLFVNKPQ